MSWKFYQPNFAADRAPELPYEYMVNGAWSGHRKFAYDLVRFMNPETVVELGTYYGTSYFSICQAVSDGGLRSRCYAVDTWEGDPHVGDYTTHGNLIYQAVNQVNQREFAAFSTMIRSNFDGASSLFQDQSVQLLHIDGYHTYQAVYHDFITWYPKLANFSVVLFHDIEVRIGDFGVYQLWEQFKSYPHMDFAHCNGLGVLFPKGCPETFKPLLNQQEAFQSVYSIY